MTCQKMILVNHHLPIFSLTQWLCLSPYAQVKLSVYLISWKLIERNEKNASSKPLRMTSFCKIYSLSNLIWISTWKNLIPTLTCSRSSSFLRKGLPCAPAGMEHWFCSEQIFYKGIWNSVVDLLQLLRQFEVMTTIGSRDMRFKVWCTAMNHCIQHSWYPK